MKHAIVWVIVIVVGVGAYVIGASRARERTLAEFKVQFESSNAHSQLGHYSAYKSIALAVTKDSKKAQCQAQQAAGAMLGGLKTCLADATCREGILEKTKVFAPEAIGEAELPFSVPTICSS
jgi:hypothetical protein